MIRPMHFRIPTDEEIHTAFEQGEKAIRALFHDVATQMAELAQQLAQPHSPELRGSASQPLIENRLR